jgi:hypothetical protein
MARTDPPTGPVPPRFGLDAFDCPYCGAYAEMTWEVLRKGPTGGSNSEICEATCRRCGDIAIWRQYWLTGDGFSTQSGRMLWPVHLTGVPPHPEMPPDTLVLYNEAREVAMASPRAAVALLRVAIDVLLREVIPGAGDKPLNAVIGLAVKGGLSPAVRVALDVLRAHGNDAAHPVQLILDEEDATAKVTGLCQQLNLAVEQLVALPRQQREAFAALPESVRKQIEQRDGGLPDLT